MTEEEARALKEEADTHEANFTTLVQKKAKITEADLVELEAAVASQERYLEAIGNNVAESSKLEGLRTRLHVYRAERLREASMAAEVEAEKARTAGKADEAMAQLRQALAHEAEIREKWVLSNLEDKGRVARLDIRLRRMEADPIWERGRQLEKEALQAAKEGRFDRADELVNAAADLERDYALRYRDVRDTEYDRVDRLHRLSATFRSQAAKAEIDARVRQAEQAEAAHQWSEAAGIWASAARDIADLNRLYPTSGNADEKTALAYSRREALARVMPEVEGFRGAMEDIRRLLRAGETAQAGAQAAAAAARLDAVGRRLPEAISPADGDRRQLAVIQERVSALSAVREAFVTQLVDLPGHPASRILRTETSQVLYQAVMGANPSATRDVAFPVESVDYPQAEDFAQRLGWLTGLKVRLPTVAELEDAHQAKGRSIPAEEAWTIDTSEGKVHALGTSKANPSGIYDLMGNVAEWAAADESSPTAPVVGGDAQSAPPNAYLPVDRVARGETSRLRGFRVVVEP